jgi:hypothetical protein
MGNWLMAERIAGDNIGLGLSGTAGPSATLLGMTKGRVALTSAVVAGDGQSRRSSTIFDSWLG